MQPVITFHLCGEQPNQLQVAVGADPATPEQMELILVALNTLSGGIDLISASSPFTAEEVAAIKTLAAKQISLS